MAITKYDPCNTDLGAFTPEADCLEEGSRIVGIILAKKGLDIETLVDDTSIDAAVAADDVRIVDKLSGNWPKATTNKKPGMGFQREKYSSSSYAIPIKHYSVDANLAFWNDVIQSDNWSAAFVFEDFSVYAALDADLAVIPMDFDVAPSSSEELGGSRMMEGLVGWTQKGLPYKLPDLPIAEVRKYFY